MELPVGCNKSFQISFIEDESLRPQEDYKWLVQTKRENGWESTTCRKSIAEAIDYATKELGILAIEWVQQGN